MVIDTDRTFCNTDSYTRISSLSYYREHLKQCVKLLDNYYSLHVTEKYSLMFLSISSGKKRR